MYIHIYVYIYRRSTVENDGNVCRTRKKAFEQSLSDERRRAHERAGLRPRELLIYHRCLDNAKNILASEHRKSDRPVVRQSIGPKCTRNIESMREEKISSTRNGFRSLALSGPRLVLRTSKLHVKKPDV